MVAPKLNKRKGMKLQKPEPGKKQKKPPTKVQEEREDILSDSDGLVDELKISNVEKDEKISDFDKQSAEEEEEEDIAHTQDRKAPPCSRSVEAEIAEMRDVLKRMMERREVEIRLRDEHNRKMEEYNREMEEYNRKLDEYNRNLHEYNRKFDAILSAMAALIPGFSPPPGLFASASSSSVHPLPPSDAESP